MPLAFQDSIPQQHLFFTLQWLHNERDGVSKLRVTGFCEGNSPVTGEFPAQRASNAENVSIWWRHHDTLRDIEKNLPVAMSSPWGTLVAVPPPPVAMLIASPNVPWTRCNFCQSLPVASETRHTTRHDSGTANPFTSTVFKGPLGSRCHIFFRLHFITAKTE